jgi:hypothetical protein
MYIKQLGVQYKKAQTFVHTSFIIISKPDFFSEF